MNQIRDTQNHETLAESDMNSQKSALLKTRRRRFGIFGAIVVILIFVSVLSLTSPLTSLLSLRKIDDYPLYTMVYRGDYQFLYNVGLEDTPDFGSFDRLSQDFACTVFYGHNEQGQALLGRNFDWKHKASLLLYTDPPDGYASVSMVDLAYLGFDTDRPPLKALNNLQDSPFWPFDGMNERGVSIGMMAVPATPGLSDPSKKTLDSLAVIRLVLDYAGNLDEAIELIQSVNIDFGGGPWLHYLISDRNNSAVVEILADRVNIIDNQQPWQVATNFLLTGKSESSADNACWRYQKASDSLENAQGVLNSADAIKLLQDVSQENTVWSVVYNLSEGEIHLAVGRDYEEVYTFDMAHRLKEIK